VWEHGIYVTIAKITCLVILDLGSSVSAIPKSICDHLDLPVLKMKFWLVYLLILLLSMLLVDLINFYYVAYEFCTWWLYFMDMDGNVHSAILLGPPFWRTTCAIIDAKEGNFKFPHKKCMEHFSRKKEGTKNCACDMCTS
jgi:hypothetical protein